MNLWEEAFVFHHDSAPAHRAKKTQTYLQDNNIETLEWPSNSSDLNVIEFIWQRMKEIAKKANPHTLNELKSLIREVWEQSTKLEAMVESMPRKIQDVINSKGDATKYWLYLFSQDVIVLPYTTRFNA